MKTTAFKELASHMHANVISSALVSGVSVDSRLTKPGDLFFALPGAQVDGHTFLKNASDNGAVAAVVNSHYAGPDYGLSLLHSDNVLHALQQLAKAYLSQSKAKIVAVTGSLGKTTTKNFLYQLLKAKFKVSVSSGNSNSQIGLPLAILNDLSLDDEISILEMGMTESGQIRRLIEIAPPDVAIVTTVALVHAGNFPSLEAIAHAKAEIFSHQKTQIALYPLESDINGALSAAMSSKEKCKKITFSINDTEADYFLEGNDFESMISFPKSISSDGCIVIKQYVIEPIPLPGAHSRHNFLAAATAAFHLGMEWCEIGAIISTLTLPERRLQRIEKFGATFINDSYNAAEMSIKAALDCLPLPKPGGKRIAVIGEIVELGHFSKGCHRAVGEYALDRVDLMLCYGQECKYISECWQEAGRPVVWSQERSGVVEALRSQLTPGDVVLLKGSRAKGVWKVLEEL